MDLFFKKEERVRHIDISQDQLNVLMGGVPIHIPTQEELFDFYVEVLREKRIVKNPDEFKNLRKAFPITGAFPFLLIPQTKFSVSELMTRVELNGQKGYNNLGEDYLKDTVRIPARHYICTNIEDGRKALNVSPLDALKKFNKEKRSGWTAKEGIFYAIYFPFVLKRHFIDLVGSRYDSDGVVSLWLNDGKPRLYWDFLGIADSRWGAASCGSRV